jgi:hypothetical protein
MGQHEKRQGTQDPRELWWLSQTPSFFPIDFDLRTSGPSTTTVGVDVKIFCHIGKGFFF